jgi:hypothetical protein
MSRLYSRIRVAIHAEVQAGVNATLQPNVGEQLVSVILLSIRMKKVEIFPSKGPDYS